MANLHDYRLWLGYGEWKDRDWRTAIKAASGLEKRLLQLQQIAVHAIAGIDPVPTQPQPVTPENLGWSVLWSRCFLLLQSAIDLRGAYSVRVVDVLHRVAFELWLQVLTIRQPWDSLNELRGDATKGISISSQRLDDAWGDVADNLRGYTTWALTNDLLFYRYRRSGSELRAIHQKTDPATLPKTPEEVALHKYLWGDISIIGESEAVQDRKRAKKIYEENIHMIQEWLTDPRFGHWTSDLAPWISDSRQNEVPTLFELLNSSNDIIKKGMEAIDMGHLYGIYSQGSMIIHGSSIKQFVGMGGTLIAPRVLATDEEGDELCSHLAEICHRVMAGLYGMRDKCLQN